MRKKCNYCHALNIALKDKVSMDVDLLQKAQKISSNKVNFIEIEFVFHYCSFFQSYIHFTYTKLIKNAF